MTREEAIKILDPETSKEEIAGYGPEQAKRIAVSQALGMAISALRAQQTPLDRSRWGYCDYCDGAKRIITFEVPDEIEVPEGSIRFEWVGITRYCPICGKPQNEEAWADLERRINGGTTD